MREPKIIDYTTSPYLEYNVKYLRQRLADSLKRLEEKRDELLNLLKAEIPDVDHAIVLMSGVVSGTKMSGAFGVQQDILHRVATIVNKMNTLTMLGANYTVIDDQAASTTFVRFTLEQAKEWDI